MGRSGVGRMAVSLSAGSVARRTVGWASVEGKLNVGLLGCGNVGGAVARMLHEHAEDIARRAGLHIESTRIAVRDPSKDRQVPVDPESCTDDPRSVVTDSEREVVAELVGAVDSA